LFLLYFFYLSFYIIFLFTFLLNNFPFFLHFYFLSLLFKFLSVLSWSSEPLPVNGRTFPSAYHGWPVCGLIVPWLRPHWTSRAGASA